MPTFLIIFIIIVVGGIISAIYSNKRKEKATLEMIEQGWSFDKKVDLNTYIGGHPKIDNAKKFVFCIIQNNKINIFGYPDDNELNTPIKLGSINNNKVKNILVENKSVVEKRVSFGRLLLVGIFAFAWKKKKKEESAYIVIEWNDGRFDHETIFEFLGKGSMANANKARNALINKIS